MGAVPARLVAVGLLVTARGAQIEETELVRVRLETTKFGPAVCNDGTPATMYLAPRPQEATGPIVWHIYLEGGGFCANEVDCRSPDHAHYTTSSQYPDRMRMKGVFSRGPGATPLLASAARVYIRYCSSDSWIGNRTVTWRDGSSWHFRGGAILRSALHELFSVGLGTANLVVFGGCSAGGRGVFYNVDGLCDIVRQTNPKTRCGAVVDAAWWLDSVTTAPTPEEKYWLGGNTTVWESALRQGAEEGPRVWGQSKIAEPLISCRAAASRGQEFWSLQAEFQPGAMLPETQTLVNISSFDNCMFGPTLAPFLKTPLLLSMQLNDYFQLDHLVRPHHPLYVSGPEGGPDSLLDMSLANALQDGLRQSLSDVVLSAELKGRLQVFATTCYGHCLQESQRYFAVRIKEGPGQGLSMNDTVAAWLAQLLRPTGSSPFPSVLLVEECKCSALNCSNGCRPRRLWWTLLMKGFLAAAVSSLGACVFCRVLHLRRRRRGTEPSYVE